MAGDQQQPSAMGTPPGKSPKNTLTLADWEQWTKETLIYTIIPILLVFAQTLQAAFMAHGRLPNASDWTLAAGAAYGTLLAAAINLLSKYKAGV